MVSVPADPEQGSQLPAEDGFHRKLEDMRHFAKDSLVVVNNIPKIKQEKYPKLVERLTPKFESVGKIRKDKNGKSMVSFVTDDNGSTLGFALAEYQNPEQAHKAVVALHKHILDKNHTFWACTASALKALQQVPVEFTPPPPLPVADRPNYKSWLLDERGRDMFMIRNDKITSIYWHDHVVKPKLDIERPGWTENGAVWSPKGTFMATFHPRGIQLWGRVPPSSEDEKVVWERVRRFEHQNVILIDFSSCENYLVTCNGTEPEKDNPRQPRAIRVWDIHTGKLKRGFLGPPRSEVGPEGQIPWPQFQWSYSDKYLARKTESSILIYESPDMKLLDKKKLRVQNVQHFSWSPTDDIMAYWTPEVENSPARVTLLQLPERIEMRQKALYSVADIMLHWHQQGKFLCCKVDRLTKSKKGQFTNFELFRVKAKDIPVEVVEYKEKDLVNFFAWEPHGNRFAVIHGHRDIAGQWDVSFFSMEGISGELKLLSTLEKKTCNQLFWSPKGRFILLAAVGTQNGALEFYDANDITPKSEVEPIGTNEHFLCNEVQWDPSGRFVSTVVSYWRNRNDNGYVIWTMYGKELVRESVDMLYQFVWRPRPASLLTPRQEKEVKKNLRTKRDRYEQEDKELRDTVSSGRAAHRRKLREAYHAYRAQADERLASEQEKRRMVLGDSLSAADEMETIVETVEEIISITSDIDVTVRLLTSDDERD